MTTTAIRAPEGATSSTLAEGAPPDGAAVGTGVGAAVPVSSAGPTKGATVTVMAITSCRLPPAASRAVRSAPSDTTFAWILRSRSSGSAEASWTAAVTALVYDIIIFSLIFLLDFELHCTLLFFANSF